jgi:hypothetical protein
MPKRRASKVSAASATFAEARYRRISVRGVPFLFVCYIVSILDRNNSNVGFAQIQMKHDLGFTDAMFSLGAVLFFVGNVLFAMPSNLLIRRSGARWTCARTLVPWGAVRRHIADCQRAAALRATSRRIARKYPQRR